jgi:hypothetical protein
LKKKGLSKPKPAPASHTRLSSAPGWLGGELATLGNRRGDVAKNHRTVLWVFSARTQVHRRRTRRSRENERAPQLKITGLSGGAPDCPVSQRRSRPTVGCAICGRRVARANGRLGTPDYPVHQPVPRPNG